jgi:hypothetical protein
MGSRARLEVAIAVSCVAAVMIGTVPEDRLPAIAVGYVLGAVVSAAWAWWATCSNRRDE